MEQHFNCKFSAITPKNLAVKLTPLAEKKLAKSAHPWIFSKSIEKVSGSGKTGDIAVIFRNRDNRIFGIGLYDPDSPIVIKMLHYHGSQVIDRSFFNERITKAKAIRDRAFMDKQTNAYRLIFGESDGLPGLIVDTYNQVLVIKLYSAIWIGFLKMLLEELIEATGCSAVVLRLSRQLQEGTTPGFYDGQIVFGHLKNEDVFFDEYGVHFHANVVKGHKTGFFLDHRENRHKVGVLSGGKTVLDVFSYAGGFAVHALANGAQEVTCIDVSQQALDLAKKNAALNAYSGKLKTIAGDAFVILKEMVGRKKRFDIIVIDPPSFAKSQKEIKIAKKKYAELAGIGRDLLKRDGILVLASCSSRVLADDFFEVVEGVLDLLDFRFELIERTAHAVDHPVGFPEAAYLKCGYYRKLG